MPIDLKARSREETYRPAMDKARREIAQVDPWETAFKAAVDYREIDPKRGEWSVPFWGKRYRVTYPEGVVTEEESGETPPIVVSPVSYTHLTRPKASGRQTSGSLSGFSPADRATGPSSRPELPSSWLKLSAGIRRLLRKRPLLSAGRGFLSAILLSCSGCSPGSGSPLSSTWPMRNSAHRPRYSLTPQPGATSPPRTW